MLSLFQSNPQSQLVALSSELNILSNISYNTLHVDPNISNIPTLLDLNTAELFFYLLWMLVVLDLNNTLQLSQNHGQQAPCHLGSNSWVVNNVQWDLSLANPNPFSLNH